MTGRDLVRAIFALPLEEQAAALEPLYRMVYDAYGVDWDLNTAALADDYAGRVEGTALLPGIPREWHGREGYLAVHRQLREVLNVRRVVLDRVIALGDERSAALMRFVIGAGDGELDQQILDWHQFRDGELVLQRIWLNAEEGLRAL